MSRLRLQPDKRLAFLQGFLRHPQRVGSVIPSSRFLERRIVEVAGLAEARVVVELGPGTGGTTRALLRSLARDAKLLAIDVAPQFVSLLREHADPRLIAHIGSAADLAEILEHYGLGRPDVVVSGVPFSTMPPALGRSILRSVWSSLAPGGCFVAYQFRDRVALLNREIAGRPEVAVELLNVPPMRIYRWRKPTDAESTNAA